MTVFNIAITSDTVCPWCYIGKNKLERGIAAYKAAHPSSSDTFTTTWLPYYLNPNAPKQGRDKQAVYEEKFGAQRTKMMQERLSAQGEAVGIHFKYGGKTGSTRDSHRLIQLAKSKGAETQTRLIEQLFEAYFENEQDITSHQVLQKAAVKAGLDEGQVKEWLSSESGGRQVDEEVVVAQRNLVTGVPNFVINDKYEIQGAQDPAGFKTVFEKIKEQDENARA